MIVKVHYKAYTGETERQWELEQTTCCCYSNIDRNRKKEEKVFPMIFQKNYAFLSGRFKIDRVAVKNSIRNGEAKELICTIQVHELRVRGCWRMGMCTADGV